MLIAGAGWGNNERNKEPQRLFKNRVIRWAVRTSPQPTDTTLLAAAQVCNLIQA
jgi:hypothetical protein